MLFNWPGSLHVEHSNTYLEQEKIYISRQPKLKVGLVPLQYKQN